MFSNIKRRVGIVAAVTVMAALVPVLSTSSATAAPATIPVAPSDSGLALGGGLSQNIKLKKKYTLVPGKIV